MVPLNVVLNANAMLKAASVMVASPRRARNAWTRECESWCSSVEMMSGRKKMTATRTVRGLGACMEICLSFYGGVRLALSLRGIDAMSFTHSKADRHQSCRDGRNSARWRIDPARNP